MSLKVKEKLLFFGEFHVIHKRSTNTCTHYYKAVDVKFESKVMKLTRKVMR